MDSTALGGLVIAGTGLVTGVGALYLNWRSQTDQKTQQAAATAVVQDKSRLEETQQALDALADVLEVTRTDAADLRGRNRQLEVQLDEERSLRQYMFSAQESRCREVQSELVEALITLRGVVVDEISAAAARDAIGRFPPHPHELPAPKPAPEGEPS